MKAIFVVYAKVKKTLNINCWQ